MSIDDRNDEPINQPEHHQRALAFVKDVIDHAEQYKGILDVEVTDFILDGLGQAMKFQEDDNPEMQELGRAMKDIADRTRKQRSVIMVHALGDDHDLIEKFLTEVVNLGENRRGEIHSGVQIEGYLGTEIGMPYQGNLDKPPALDGSVLMRFNNLANLDN